MICMSEEVDKIIRKIMENNPDKDARLLCLAVLELRNDVKTIKKQMSLIRWLLGSILFMLVVNILGMKFGGI